MMSITICGTKEHIGELMTITKCKRGFPTSADAVAALVGGMKRLCGIRSKHPRKHTPYQRERAKRRNKARQLKRKLKRTADER